MRITARFGDKPTRRDYTWSTYDNALVIDPKTDKNFQREGIYYVMVSPKTSFWDAFKKNITYQYLLSYYTEDSYIYLKD